MKRERKKKREIRVSKSDYETGKEAEKENTRFKELLRNAKGRRKGKYAFQRAFMKRERKQRRRIRVSKSVYKTRKEEEKKNTRFKERL